MTTTQELIKVLGGHSTIKQRVETAHDLTRIIREGIPFLSLQAFSTAAKLDMPTVSRILMIPSRTLARRREAKRLMADESDRLVRLARVFAHAVDVFGTYDKAATWLQRPNRALQNQTPLELLDTDVGVQSVDTVLGRLEHGVYS